MTLKNRKSRKMSQVSSTELKTATRARPSSIDIARSVFDRVNRGELVGKSSALIMKEVGSPMYVRRNRHDRSVCGDSSSTWVRFSAYNRRPPGTRAQEVIRPRCLESQPAGRLQCTVSFGLQADRRYQEEARTFLPGRKEAIPSRSFSMFCLTVARGCHLVSYRIDSAPTRFQQVVKLLLLFSLLYSIICAFVVYNQICQKVEGIVETICCFMPVDGLFGPIIQSTLISIILCSISFVTPARNWVDRLSFNVMVALTLCTIVASSFSFYLYWSLSKLSPVVPAV